MRPLESDVGPALPAPVGTPWSRVRWRTTVGLKVTMGATGVILVTFLVFHLLGNLLVYQGPASLNAYSALLLRDPSLLWAARVVLLASALLHIGAAALLWSGDRSRRPVPYRRLTPRSATLASRTMRLSGFGIAIFIVLHLLHLTTGTIEPVPFHQHDVYHNVVGGFRVGWVVGVYLIAMILIGMHVWHGAWASVRSLGLSRPSPRPKRRPVAWVLALFLWAGFTSIPLAIWFGAVR